jgi:mono/diheme cytochrome c family protein
VRPAAHDLRGAATVGLARAAGTVVAVPGGMKKTCGMLVSLVAFAVLPASARAASAKPEAAAPSGVVEIWIRGAGPMQGDLAPRARTQRLDLDKLRLVDAKRFDAQYDGVRALRGIPLASVIDSFAPDPSVDLAILHFANGMAVPVAFRDAEVMKKLDPFIARGVETSAGGPIRVGAFPAIRRKGSTADPRPIVFGGNKLVVAALWHPAVATAAQPAFSPWRHTDTLTGIELVAAKPYYHQFEAGGGDYVVRGLAVFQQSCQFCHGVRKVGAKFGWDFVDPTPIWSYHNPPKSLFLHVAYKPLDAAERGLMMPAMSFMSQDDAALLWQWLKAVATNPMAAYATAAPAPPR